MWQPPSVGNGSENLVLKYIFFRCMVFSDDGTTLLGCGNDGLHVVGWEPARVFDTVHGHWGQTHDITVAQTQLVSTILCIFMSSGDHCS